MNEKPITLILLTHRQVYGDQMSIKKRVILKKKMSVHEKDTGEKKNWKGEKNENVVERKKTQQVNLFAIKRELSFENNL